MGDPITEADILESSTVRSQQVDRVHVLDKVKAVVLLPDDLHATTEMVASFYEVPSKTITTLVQRNRSELESNGLTTLRGAGLREFKDRFRANLSSDVLQAARLTLFPRKAILNVGQLLADSPVAKAVRGYLLEVEAAAPPDLRKSAYQRLVEKVQNREFRDLIAANATDYAPKDPATRMVFAQAQNLLYLRTVGMTADEIKATREIENWDGKTGPTKKDRSIAKNYLTPDELSRLTKLETLLMARAEMMFGDGHTLTMMQWLELIKSESTPEAVERVTAHVAIPAPSSGAGSGPGRGSPRRGTQRGRSRQPRS